MKIISLTANNVYGYLPINIEFNRDITFITGVNGSGKTTAIRLLNALLTPSAKELNLIPFDEARVSFEVKKKTYDLICKKNEDQISLSIPKITDKLFFIPQFELDELEYRVHEKNRGTEFFTELIMEERKNEIIKFLLETPSPIFLGLDRKTFMDEDSYIMQPPSLRIPKTDSTSRFRRVLSGNLGSGLYAVQDMIAKRNRKIRNHVERLNTKLKDNLIKSNFQYMHFDDLMDTFDGKTRYQREKLLLERRQEIESTLISLGVNIEGFMKEINNFFDGLEKLLKKQSENEKEHIEVEWLINKAQINKIIQFIEIMDEAKKNIDRLYKPLNLLTDIMNKYLKQSGKSIEIDVLGNLYVKRPNNKTVGIESLSSGERQILIIFAHAILRNTRTSVFIIDEPELSLHLEWQENFISDLLSIESNSQFLLATHSPEIVAGYESRCKGVTN